MKFELKGTEELMKTLKEISADLKVRGGRTALRKAANVIRDDAKRRAEALDDPNTPEKIADNISTRLDSKHFRKTGDLKFEVGVRGGAGGVGGDKSKNKGGDTWYWRFLEFGTEHMPAKPFMRPAMDANYNRAAEVFIEEYKKALDRAIKRGQR